MLFPTEPRETPARRTSFALAAALLAAGCTAANVSAVLPTPGQDRAGIVPTQPPSPPLAAQPTTRPTTQPTAQPSPVPSPQPSTTPSNQPTVAPSPATTPGPPEPTDEPPSTVRGRVTVAGVPRAGALVRLVAGDQVFEAASAEDGSYALFGVPSGTWVLIVRVAGAETRTLVVVVP